MKERRIVTVAHQQYSGPLPQPADLEKYDMIVPGAAERILQMAEKEQEKRHKSEAVKVDTAAKLSLRGQWIGLFLALLFAAISVYLATKGFEKLAAAFSAPLIIGVCSIFVLRRGAKTESK